MRKLQNIVSNFGNGFVRQGNQLVVRIESVRSLRASSSASYLSALDSTASRFAAALPALGLDAWLDARLNAWQWSSITAGKQKPVGTAKWRHTIMCHRAAA